ncbi:MAG: DUF393 domain-containing protein [Chloroflexi bacterium]|nr:DUF393 domain-containing protein [Chloroflexota bacterium]
MLTQTWTFYYDADCGMCTAVVRWLSRFDTRERITWTAIQSLETPPRGLSHADLERAAYLVCAPGDNHEGFFAFRKLLMKLPLLIPLGALMWIPGARFIGVPAYRWVARNRYRISGCRVPGIGGSSKFHSD